MDITPEFLATSLIVVLIPGTGVVFTIATGIAQGARGSVYATWRDRSALVVADAPKPSSALALVVKAFLLNILNPKLTIFFLAFLPQFVRPEGASPLAQLLGLSAVFMAMTFAVFVVYGLLAHAFRRHVVDAPRVQAWLRRGFAAAFAGLGLQLAVSER